MRRPNGLGAALLLWLLVWCAAPGFAAVVQAPVEETRQAITAQLDAEVAHDQVAMPQLDFKTFPSQIFWLIASFALLYYLLARKALPRLTDILETRQAKLSADLDRAAELRAAAEAALQRYETLVQEAQSKAAAALKELHDRSAAEIASRQAELQLELARRVAAAETRIRQARETALAELAEVAAEAARSATERLAGITVSAEEARSTVYGLPAETR